MTQNCPDSDSNCPESDLNCLNSDSNCPQNYSNCPESDFRGKREVFDAPKIGQRQSKGSPDSYLE